MPELRAGRRLIVMRHAKAEGFGSDDHRRVLTERGRRDAVASGLWLAQQGCVPDYAMVSSAARTVGTWEGVATGSRSTAEVVLEDALYSASPEAAIEILRGAPVDAETLIMVGHNPTAAYVAHVLDDGRPDPVAFRDMSEGYPTSAMTVIEIPCTWDELSEGVGHIAAFHVGNGSAAAR